MPTSPSKKPSQNGIVLPDPQITEKAPRRAHSAKFKLQLLQEADLCSTPGEIGALLRREGLYSSQLAKWRRLREKGQLSALSSEKRGPKPEPVEQTSAENVLLRKQVLRLEKQLHQANLLLDLQKKVAQILNFSQDQSANDEND